MDMSKDPVVKKLFLPADTDEWTEDQRHAYFMERLRGALDLKLSRERRNSIVMMNSDRIRKPEVLSEEILRRRVEDEINGVDPKAKKNARITQKGGLEILEKLLDRIEEANKQPFAYSIGAVILFGSWDRNDKPHAGDIDVAVEFIANAPPGDAFGKLLKSRVAAARAAGRDLLIPLCYSWPRVEVGQFIQNRSRGVSLVSLDQISQTMEPNEKPFSYTVLRGDPGHIAKMFKRSEFKLKAHRIRMRDPKTGEITTLFDDGALTRTPPEKT